MPSIAELRSSLGAFAEDKNDEQILQLAANAMGVSPGRIASEYGYKPTSSGIAGLRTGAAIDQYQAGLYGLGEAITGADFFRRGREANEFESNVALERARAQGAIGSFEEVQGLSDVPSYLGGLAIGSAPYALEALGGGLAARGLMTGTRAALGAATTVGDAAAAARAAGALRAGQTAGGVAAAYPSSVGGILQAQREQADETDLGAAAALGVPFAALNALGIEGALARQQLARSGISALDNLQGFRGGLARAGATGLRTGLVEGGTETLQEMTSQIGRMAVDPNEAFLSDAALGRYKEAAIGGAFLGGTFGGATGFGRSEGYRAPMAESDLTKPLDTTARPDPSQFVTQDQTVGLKKFIDETTGVVRPSRKEYEKQFEAAFNEPSGQFVADAATGVERELTVGELMQRGSTAMDLTQDKPADTAAAATAATKVATTRDPRDIFLRDELKVTPNNNSRQLFTLMEAEGIDPKSPTMIPVWNYAAAKYLSPKRLEKAIELMDKAIIESRKEAPSGAGISTVQQPAGSVGVGSPVVQGSVGDAGRVAPVAGAVDGGAPTAGAPLQQAGILPSTTGQPSTPVTTTAPAAAPAPETRFRRAPKPMTVLEAANAAKAAKAQQAETQGSQAPAAAGPVTPEVDPRQAILQQIFGQRNGDIIFDVVGMGMPEPEAATKYGLSRQAIQKIAGATGQKTWPERIARAKAQFGLTDEQIADAFNVTPQEQLGSEVEREVFGAGATQGAMSENEAIEAGLENIVKTAGAGTSEVEGFTKLQREIDATLEALAVETDDAKLAELNATLAAQIEKVKAVEKKVQAEVRRSAGKVTEPTVEEEANAVQVESPAGVSVQPEAGTGKKVGGQVRRAKKPAAESKAQVPAKILTEAEQAAQAWDVVAADFPTAPKFADLTKAQQQNFIEFGPDNWTKADVETELTKLARTAAPTQRAIRLRHGTTAANKAMIEKLGHMDPEGGERQYTYSEFGRKAVYLTRPEGWWLDKEKAAAGRAVVYDDYVDVELPSDANIVTINNMADFEALAKRVGEPSAKSMANKLAVDGLDWLSQAKELRSMTLDQAAQKYIREQKESATKYGGFDTTGINTLGELADFLNANVNNQYTQTTEAELRTRIRDNWLDAKSYELDTFGESDAMTQKLIDAGVDVIDIAPDADVGVAADQVVVLRPELVKLTSAVKQQEAFLRKSRRSVRTADQSGVEFESVEASLEDLSNYSEGIAAGIRSLRNSGMGNAVDAIDSWMVTFSPVSWDAIYTMIDGKRTIIYNGVILKDKVLATTATLHEVGHGIDEVQTGAGKFSNDKEFKLSRVNGELMSMRPGTVVDELLNHWEDASETSALGGMLNYPLDMTDPENRTLTMQELREELFAQVWAFSNMNGGMDYLRDNLPTTFAFMEKAHEQVKATNYKRAEGAQQGAQSGQVQAGQQNAQPAGTILRASRQAKQGLIDRNIAKLPKQSQQPVKRVTQALGDLGGKYLDYAVFTNDLVKRAQALGLGAAKTFSDRLAARNAKVSEEERKIEKIADRYASIEDANKGSGPGSVNEFLFESTRTGKWGYGKYRDAKMGAAFDKLGPKAQQFVKDVFAHGDATLSNKKKIVLEAANSEYDAMIKAAQDDGDTKTEATLKAEKAATLKRFQTLFRIREGIPYAPIKRTGAYVVIGESADYKAAKAKGDTATVKKLESDPDHYHVSFVDTKWQARNLSDKLAEQGVFDSPQIVKRSDSFDEAFSGEAMLPALTKMRAAVDRRSQDANGKKDPTAGKLLNIINQLYLEALAEGSARKSEMRRRGVAGEVDMLQSFTQQGRADANFLASVEFEPKIQDALQQMRNQSRTGDRERKSEIFDELTQRYADSLEPKDNPFINGLTNMASKFFLASSPGYYLQNLTQPFMMSLPAMAGRHDYTKAAAELAKAYTELGPLFKDVKLFDEQFDFSKVPADVRTAINDLVNQGKIDIGLATEINEYKVEADGNLSKFAQRLNKGMRMAVQKVEATNRLSTAIAAYRLEFARTKDAEKATQYAADILTDTHGDYTAFNAPRAFNTQWGKVALQFRKFQLIQTAFYAKLIRDAFTNPAERAAALKTLGYSLGHTAVFAGMMGLPGYAAISAILSAFGDEDEPYDLTAEMRKALGPEWADMIMRGAPTVVGMDLSGKIGAGNMLSIMPFSDADLSTNAGRAEAFGTLMGGAALGMTSRVIDGLGLIASGDYYKGVERVMPKGVSDALKAGRQGAEGMTRRNGDVILPDSEIGAIDTVLTALGLPAVKQAVTYERQNRMRDITENFSDRTTRIKNDYAKAVREKDTEGMAEARAAWTKLQQTRQRNGLTPQPVSNLLKAPQEQKAREQRTVGGVQYREGQRKLAESVAAD